MIPESELINGGLYRVGSRNYRVAIWDQDRRVFIGPREKFSLWDLETCLHVSNGRTVRQVAPVKHYDLTFDPIPTMQDDPKIATGRSCSAASWTRNCDRRTCWA